MTRRAAALALLCIAPPLLAQSFEGTVSMNVTSDNGTVHAVSYMLKGGKLRFDPGGGEQMSVIIDPGAQRMTVIMKAQKMYMERDFAGTVAAVQQQVAGRNAAVTRTGRFETIAGYKCEHVTVADDDGLQVDSCITPELGGLRLPAASNPMAPQREAGWLIQIGAHNFPLKVQKGGKVIMLVTAIEKKPLDASLFTAPEGYQAFAMPARKPRGR